MPSYYSSIAQSDGYICNAVFDTETNLITYTVISPQQISASASASPDALPPYIKIINQLRQAGQTGGIQIATSLNTLRQDVKEKAVEAAAAAQATGSSVPQNPDPPPPQTNPSDPDTPPENPPEPEEQLTGEGYTIPPENEEEGPELLTPPDPDTPEELNGYGYTVPPEDEEAGPELLTPPDPDAPEELDGYGYTIPEEPEGELLLTKDPQYVSDDEAQGYGEYPVGEPVLAEDGTPSGLYRNPETGELYDPNGQINYEQPESSTAPEERGLVTGRNAARSTAYFSDQYRTNKLQDWRIRLSLAPSADYLYMSDQPGILAPLAATNGVVFPYTPNIQTSYTANYDTTNLIHSNYKIYQYGSSAVEQISITCDFTAQDTFEANYLMSVIHFFKSVTKMFYALDQNPRRGTPPPLLFLSGLGEFQYNKHPLVLSSFTYNLPNDVDYIRAYLTPKATAQSGAGGAQGRLGTTITQGGLVPKTVFTDDPSSISPSYVPTKINIQLALFPIVTRNAISTEFSLKQYGTGNLISTKGIW